MADEAERAVATWFHLSRALARRKVDGGAQRVADEMVRRMIRERRTPLVDNEIQGLMVPLERLKRVLHLAIETERYDPAVEELLQQLWEFDQAEVRKLLGVS